MSWFPSSISALPDALLYATSPPPQTLVEVSTRTRPKPLLPSPARSSTRPSWASRPEGAKACKPKKIKPRRGEGMDRKRLGPRRPLDDAGAAPEKRLAPGGAVASCQLPRCREQEVRVVTRELEQELCAPAPGWRGRRAGIG